MKDQVNSSYARIVDTPAVVKTLILISLFGNLAIGVVYWLENGIQETSISLFIVALVSLGLLFLHRFGYSQAAGLILYLLISLMLTFNISIGHAIYDEAMIAFPLLIIFSGLIFGKRASVLVTGITVFQICLIYILAQAGHVRPFGGAVQVRLEETITTLIILISSGFLVWVVIDIIENAVEKILLSEQELENAYDLTLAAWAKALELRGREAPGHSGRVTTLATLLAEQMGIDEGKVWHIRQGAMLHDIGKMGIPENILLKTNQLDRTEKQTLVQHTSMAKDIIKDIDYLSGALEIVSYHHERYDGSGYPGELSGEKIPLSAQIFSIVDCWDMLRTRRPCREAKTDQEALVYLREQSGKKFNPEVVEAFLKMVDKYVLEESI